MRRILCLVLAIVMCFGSAVAMYAEETSKVYISDIKIGYGSVGKEKLINAGYKVDDNFNVNQDGRGKYADSSVWIGFKETNNPLEAITDIAVMNMDGAYTFSGWAEEYQTIKDNINSMYEDFAIGINEFRENLQANSPYAIAAYDTMNYFLDTGFTNKRIGDLFKSESTTESQIKNVLMMGNYEFVKCIKQCIAIACTEWKQNEDGAFNTFVDRLNKNGYCTDTPDPSYNHERELISFAITNLAPDILEAEANRAQYYNSYSVDKESYKLDEKAIPAGCSDEELDELQFENYINLQCTENQKSDYFYFKELIKLLKNVTIKPEKINKATRKVTQARESLYDLVKKDAAELKESDLETIRKSMTAGQIGILDTIGLPLLLFYESGVGNISYEEVYESKMEDLEEEYGNETVSVYHGVDISIFLDPANTALTSDAHTAMKVAEGSFGVDPHADTSAISRILIIVGYVVMFGIPGAAVSAYVVMRLIVKFASEAFLRHSYAFMSSFAKFLGILAIVAFFVGLIILIVGLRKKPKEEDDIIYTRIPKNIVHAESVKDVGVAEQKVYYTYTCAELINADKDAGNSLDIYGDLNQHNGKNQWVAVYYTKNRSCGKPITSTVVLQESNQAPSGYMAIHDFGTSAASDLNMYNSGSDKKSIYGFIKTTSFETKQENPDGDGKASVFGTGSTVMLAVLTFAAGAAVSGVITYSGTKKKYKKA